MTYDKSLRTQKLYITLQLEDNFVIISINFHGVVMFMILINLQCTINYCSRTIYVHKQNLAKGKGLVFKIL